MIYLLYGSDTQKSRNKLDEVVAEFRKKNGGDLNIHHFDAEEEETGKIKSALETRSLFASKKLAVIKYATQAPEREMLYSVLEKFKNDQSSIIFLWERGLGKEQLAEMRPYCDKTQEFKKGEPAAPEIKIFRLGDNFFSSSREGLRSLLQLLNQGHDEMNIFSYLANHARSLLTIKAYAERNQPLPSSAGIHPYVAQKAAAIVRPHTTFSLTTIFKRFFQEDAKIKTGLSKPRESLFRLLLSRK